MQRIFLIIIALAMIMPMVPGLYASEVTVGTGDELARYPFNFYWKSSLFQCLFFPNELGFVSGTITQLKFYNDFSSSNTLAKPIQIWLGTTQQNDLSSGYIPSTQLSLVFDGVMDFPSGQNIITINLQAPYMHTSGNLVLMSKRPIDTDYFSSTDYFECQTIGSNRARYMQSDSIDYDPANPDLGFLNGQFPKTTFVYSQQATENDLAALSITGNLTPFQDQISRYQITIKNNGINTQNNYQVKLKNTAGEELTSMNGPSIAALETLELSLDWTPTTPGPMSIYGEVLLAGDEFDINNQTSTLNISIQPPGDQMVAIGDGVAVNTTTGNPSPYGTYYKNFRQQYLFTAQEIMDAGGVPGLITALSFNVQCVNNCSPMPDFAIRLKNTSQTALTTTFEVGDYSQVFYEDNYLPTTGWNVHDFDEPFLWDGVSNLIVESLCSLNPDTYGQNASVYYTPTTGVNTCLRYQSESVDAGTATATGTLSPNRANIRFTFNAYRIGALEGTVTSGTNPVGGVLLSVQGTNRSTESSPLGSYLIQFLYLGTHTVTASKIGYEDQSATVTLVADQIAILDFNLTPSASVTVSGHVVGSDDPSYGLPDAEITLQGPLSFSGTTDAQGNFNISGVLSGYEYHYNITMVDYDALTGTVFVGSTNHDMGTLIVPEASSPPRMVTAQVIDDYTQVQLTWRPPGSAGDSGLIEDFEFDDGGWESSGYGDWEWTANFDVSQYVDIDTYVDQPPQEAHSGTGMWGTVIHGGYNTANAWSYLRKSFNLIGVSSPVLSFWHYMDGYNTWDYGFIKVNGVQIWGDAGAAVFMPWQELTFDLSQWANNADVEISFEWFASATVSYAGWYIDDVYVGQALSRHTHFANHAPKPIFRSGLNEEEEAGRLASTRISRNNGSTNRTDSRLHLGYKVWRLNAGQEHNEANWTLLTANTITDTTYTDPAWATLPNANYLWAVKAVFTNNVSSDPAFSNTLPILRNDLAAQSIAGNLTPTVGIPSTYTVRVKNMGTDPQLGADYSVKLMSGTQELLSLPGVDILPSAMHNFVFSWTPTTAGPMDIYGKVVLSTDTIAANDQTAPLSIGVWPEGTQGSTIGIGDQNTRIPMDFYYKNSLYQCIYLESELGFLSGTISGLMLYNNFITNNLNGATKIYLGSTNQSDLSNDWISATQMTLVFDGNVVYPSGENEINIPFQTPYMHAPGNLVMMINRPMDGSYYSSADCFKCQSAGTNRARNAYSDTVVYDPNNPNEGTVTGLFPKATFFYTSELIENDLGATSISGNNTPTVGAASNYTVRIKNNGTEDQDNYTVKIVSPSEEILASVAGPPINSLQTLDVVIPWTPTTSGSYDIYAMVEMDDDEFPQNNRTANLNLMVNPAGVFALTVGDGNQDARVPIDFYYSDSIFETLYYPDEMRGFIGQIIGIQFYNNFSSSITQMPISMWLGTTTQNDLSGGYIPATQLTQVFDGPLDFPAGQNIISVIFNEPYMYLDGGNLVLLIHKEDTAWHSSLDYFKCQAIGNSRALNLYSNSVNYNPNNPPAGNLSNQFPMTTFIVIPNGVGDITGTVIGANNQPLAGVSVSLNDGLYNTTTNAAGEYQLINVEEGNYDLSFSKHGYQSHTQTIVLEEDDELTIDVTLELLPQVSLSGTILASDTGAGIPGALIVLSGYEPYNANTNASGVFTIPNVYASHTYEYNISANGYTSENGLVIVPTTDHDMGEITLNEVVYAPVGVAAAVNDIGDEVDISWLAPDPNALEIVESFENTDFPPDSWEQIITNNGLANALGIRPTWCRVPSLTITGDSVIPTDGNFQAGLYWDYNHQDEWLITPSFNCPPSAYLRFDGYVYLGSTNGDHYYVKISTDDGDTWTVLWDASAQSGGWNEYTTPITVDLSAYSGNQIKVAFNAVDPDSNDGLWYFWFIDNLYIGNSITAVQFAFEDMIQKSASSNQSPLSGSMPTRAKSRYKEEGGLRAEPSLPKPHEIRYAAKNPRMLTGYLVYRLQAEQEQNEAAWVELTPEAIAELSLSDPTWANLPSGNYRWAIKAVYTNGVTSVASFSNTLSKEVQTGMIVGTVRRQNTTSIAGATVTNGYVTATTNIVGAYSLVVPVGSHAVTASAPDFVSQTIEDVVVNHNLSTTLNFILEEGSDSDDPQLPVLATMLNGNFPNPFNPETTISYSVKEPGKVKLEVYNIKGQLVRSLVNESQATGHYKLVFDSKDKSGRSISSGVYMLKMSAPGYQKTSKMILMQ